MLTLIIVTAVLAVLYGLAWRDQSARENQSARPGSRGNHAPTKARKVSPHMTRGHVEIATPAPQKHSPEFARLVEDVALP
jgi:hypothetical protein